MTDPAGDPYRLSNGQELACVVCKNNRFERASWKLQTTGMTMFNLDWANRDATCLVCTACDYIHWFDNQG